VTAAASPVGTLRQTPSRSARAWAAGYGVLAVAGAVGTWYYNLQYTGGDYLGAWFANPASSSAAVDVIVTAVVACLFYVREGRRLGWWWPVALVPLTFAVALAFTFPLFLAARELRAYNRT
jgi:Terpene cyclase DEP1